MSGRAISKRGGGIYSPQSAARTDSCQVYGSGKISVVWSQCFVKEVLSGQEEKFNRRYWLRAQGYDIEQVVKRVAEVLAIDVDEIWKPGNQPLRVRARSLTCFWAVRELGMSGTSVGKMLGLGQPAVSRAVVRGEKISRDMNIQLVN